MNPAEGSRDLRGCRPRRGAHDEFTSDASRAGLQDFHASFDAVEEQFGRVASDLDRILLHRCQLREEKTRERDIGKSNDRQITADLQPQAPGRVVDADRVVVVGDEDRGWAGGSRLPQDRRRILYALHTVTEPE
jgi:hypothetical protein